MTQKSVDVKVSVVYTASMAAQILIGDCLKILPELSDGSVDMVMVDPPYGTTQCAWDSVIPLEAMWDQLRRIVKPEGAMVFTASQPFTTVLIASNMEMFRYEWIWEKNKASGHLNAKKMPMKNHENVLVFYRKPPVYNPQKTDGHEPMNYAVRKTTTEVYGAQRATVSDAGTTLRYPKTVLSIPVVNNDSGGRHHPTQKPVALMEYLIRTYTNEGETVLDFAMGSGTTGVACVNSQRNFIGIEKDAAYAVIAQKRIDVAEDKAAAMLFAV